MLIQLHVSAVGWTRIALRLVNRLTVPDPHPFMTEFRMCGEKSKITERN